MDSKTKKLWTQFASTTYVADVGPIRVELRPASTNSVLDYALRRADAKEWAFVTAANPGETRPKRENVIAQKALVADLLARGHTYFEGWGIPDPPNPHPPEPSYLVFGLSEREAVELGRRFGQIAVLVGKVGGVAKLVRCDGEQ